jgi:hypothetical protein
VPYRDNGRERQEYRLTEAGADLLPVMHALRRWGIDHTEPDAPTAPHQIIHLACGHPTADDQVCDHCGQPVLREEEAWLPSWRTDVPLPLAPPVTPHPAGAHSPGA